ncbi:MAG: protein translocase subunit SecD [Acidimicrobiia bacterium]|nr:protein translocase subunit SecD [Acidimicrobiia bacterium]
MNRRPLWISLILTLALAWGSLAAMLASNWEPKLGLDLQGGFSVVLAAPEGIESDVLDQAVETMRRRIESLGAVQEPEISVQGDRRILVQLPGVEDRERALSAVGTTGQLTFRPVLDIQAVAPEAGLSLTDDPGQTVVLQDESGIYYVLGPAFLTGADLTGAEPGFGGVQIGGGGGWTVDPSFTSEGGDKFEAATGVLSTFTYGDPRRQLAIVLDGTVISAPSIAAEVGPGETLPADTVVITIGDSQDSQREAEDLATVLKYGALPTTFERESEGSVSASLGSDSLRAGLLAGLAGLILVAIALVAYYRVLGLIAVVGFTVFGSLLIGTIIFLGQVQGTTLTLSGVTGIIVSIGITADSYIVFFERVKEEHRRGRALKPAVDYGFKRAFRTIVTADTVTFVGSVLLWLLAIGPVKGFALTLGIATIIDVLVAYFFTRPFAQLLVRSRFGEGGALSIRGAMGRSAAEGVAS